MRWVAPRVDWPVRPCGIGAGDVEIAERDIAEVVRRRGVGEHHLGHQLGAAVGRLRR